MGMSTEARGPDRACGEAASSWPWPTEDGEAVGVVGDVVLGMVDSIVADCRQDDVQWAEAAAEPVALKVLNTHKPGDCDVMDVDDERRNSIMAPHASPPSLKTVLPSGSPLIQSNAHQPPCTALADPHSAAPEKDIANMGRVIALCSQNALQRSMERTAAAKRRVEQLWERLGWDSREQKRARAEAEESAG